MGTTVISRRRALSLAALALVPGGGRFAIGSPVRPGAPSEVGLLAWTPLASAHAVRAMDGLVHVSYELLLTNVSRYDVAVGPVEVRDARTGRPTRAARTVSADGKDVTWQLRGFWITPTEDAVDYGTRLAPRRPG